MSNATTAWYPRRSVIYTQSVPAFALLLLYANYSTEIVCMWSKYRGFFFFFPLCRSSFSSTIYWKDFPFVIDLPWYFCQTSINQTCGSISELSIMFHWPTCLPIPVQIPNFLYYCSFIGLTAGTSGQNKLIGTFHPLSTTISILQVGFVEAWGLNQYNQNSF